MSTMTGVVEKVHNRGGRYALLIDGEWFGMGYNKPKFEEGSTVKFEVEMNGKYKNVVVDTLKAKPGESSSTRGASTRGAGSYAQKEQYWADKEARDIDTQKRISYQAATNTALALVTAALDREFLKIPASTKGAARYDAFVAMVTEEAERIFAVYQRLPENADALLGAAVEEEKEEEPDVDVEAEDDGWEDV